MNYESFLSADSLALRPSEIRRFARLINDPSIISFAGGVPSSETFPSASLISAADAAIRERAAVSLQYGPTPGLPELRAHVAMICRGREIDCDAEAVMITTGSQQAIWLAGMTLLDPGDVALVELPTYIGGLSAFYGRRVELRGVVQDEDGIDPDDLRKRATECRDAGKRVKILYTIPNFQNPSGRLLASERRRAILDVAEEFDFLIIEDDPYGELVYVEGCDTTPIRSLDRTGRVVYLGSFSKVLSPGLRCGWISAEPDLLRRFELAKEGIDLCSGMLDQSIVLGFLDSGELPDQISRVRDFYRRKRATLMDALTDGFADLARWTDAKGGLFTFVTLCDDVDTSSMIGAAIERGVAYIPGGAFFVDGSGRNTMRLTFAKETDERIRECAGRLAEVVRSCRP